MVFKKGMRIFFKYILRIDTQDGDDLVKKHNLKSALKSATFNIISEDGDYETIEIVGKATIFKAELDGKMGFIGNKNARISFYNYEKLDSKQDVIDSEDSYFYVLPKIKLSKM